MPSLAFNVCYRFSLEKSAPKFMDSLLRILVVLPPEHAKITFPIGLPPRMIHDPPIPEW